MHVFVVLWTFDGECADEVVACGRDGVVAVGHALHKDFLSSCGHVNCHELSALVALACVAVAVGGGQPTYVVGGVDDDGAGLEVHDFVSPQGGLAVDDF